jgi:hypothetical protein
VTTVVVCGAAALLLPSPCEGAVAVDSLDPAMNAAPERAPASSGAMNGARWSEPDPFDNDDDDDDDAAPDAPAAATAQSWSAPHSDVSAVHVVRCLVRPIQPLDGQNLRGPPAGDAETSPADLDDDDDFSSSSSRGLSARHHSPDRSSFHSEPARRRVPDRPPLRAP